MNKSSASFFVSSRIFLLAIACVSCLLLLLASCRASPESDAIRFGLASAPITLDPRYATDAISSRINRLIYRQLVDFNQASQPVPSLATWEKLTPVHFRFHLQSADRKFHDGTKLTSNDVKATYDSILEKTNASPHRSTLHMLEKVVVVDEDTLDFHLKFPDPLFPGYLEIGILPANKLALGHPFNTHPVGSGPFRFVAWPEKDKLELLRIRDRQAFTFLHVKDENTRVLKLLRGELDMLQNDIDAELVKRLESNQGVVVKTASGSNFSYIGFNMEDDVVGQQRVREAIAYAIDRQSIVRHLFSGRAKLASTLLTPNHWAGHPNLSKYSYAPEQSRKILATLGYSRENPLKFIYKTSSNPFRIRLATVIQSQLADVGIDVELRTYDWGTFYGDIKAGNFQMYTLAWVGINLPDIFRNVFHSASVPPSGANRGRYSNSQVDSLLSRAQVEQDATKQADLYRAVQEIVYEELPYVPLWYEDHVFITRNTLKGYVVHTDGNYDGLESVERITNMSLADAYVIHD